MKLVLFIYFIQLDKFNKETITFIKPFIYSHQTSKGGKITPNGFSMTNFHRVKLEVEKKLKTNKRPKEKDSLLLTVVALEFESSFAAVHS